MLKINFEGKTSIFNSNQKDMVNFMLNILNEYLSTKLLNSATIFLKEANKFIITLN